MYMYMTVEIIVLLGNKIWYVEYENIKYLLFWKQSLSNIPINFEDSDIFR